MQTMEKLCNRFTAKYHELGYSALFDSIESHKGYYKVAILDWFGNCYWHIFRSCSEFAEWIDGVVLD